MAKVKLSAIISDLRGKLQNVVFTGSRSGLNIRTRVKPTNPNTSFQSAVRAFFAVFTVAFRSLSEVNIALWNATAAIGNKSNVFGDSYRTTGHKLFVAQNVTNGLFGDGNQIDEPITPVIPDPVGISAIDFDSDPETATVTLDDAVPADTVLVITASSQLSAGVSNATGKLVVIKTFPAATGAGDLDIATEYTAHFGTLVKDRKVFIQAYLTNTHATKKVTKYKQGAELSAKVK